MEGQSVAHAGTRRGWAARAALGLALWGCADLLGIPSEPRLVEVPQPAASPPPDPLAPSPLTAAPGAGPASAAAGDGVQQVTGLSPGPSTSAPQTHLDAPSDAGVVPPVDAGGSPDCPAGSTGTLPMDIVLILDNSGSMQAGTTSVERGLGAWAALLDAGGLDYRLILLSRHRTLERAESGAASTSICVARPLSGLASCPSPEPVLSERFFQYSVKIDATDSLLRALESYATPDSFNLAPMGWSAWLRPGARKVFIEISDADSELPASEFVARLSALSPEQFGSDPAAPRFVFHSIVGLLDKPGVDGLYRADEPIQGQKCTEADRAPDNAGETYQALSRLTGGVRLALCPSAAIDVRLFRLAAELLPSRAACAPPPAATVADSN